jgi:hypothetical protein
MNLLSNPFFRACGTLLSLSESASAACWSRKKMIPTDEEKLNLLQRLDRFRVWNSLDDKRYCLVCGQIVTGRGIQVVRPARGGARLRILCPTPHCDSRPVAWALPTEEVLIAMVEDGRRRNLWNKAR